MGIKEEPKQGRLNVEAHQFSAPIPPYRLREARERTGTVSQVTITADGTFGITHQELVTLVTNSNDPSALRQRGGVTGIGDLLETDLGKGVDGDPVDLIRRKNAFGSNTYPQKQAKTFWRLLREASDDWVHWVLILFAVAFMVEAIVQKKGLHEGWSDGVSIAAAVIIFTVVKALLQNYMQYRMFSKSNPEHSQNTFKVIRSGIQVEVLSHDIVVGDVVLLNCGDDVPADGVIIKSDSLTIDEFNITKERHIVPKDSVKAPILKSGGRVENGNCTMLVTCVGINTQWGLLLDTIPAENVVTHLQACLIRITTTFAWPGIVSAFIFVVILLFRLFTGKIRNAVGIPAFIRGKTKFRDAIIRATQIAIIGVCILMVGVPEGFPLLVHLSVACLIDKMAEDVIVRKISACESMAYTTIICFHRTGTGITIEDPRQDQVRQLQNAGVKICMITRENLATAKEIALECGILGSDESQQSEPNVIDGSVFRSKTDSERKQIADKITVMFQASSEDKFLLVKALKKMGKVVAYRGHDSSDASALLQANISITSVRGTQFAKDNSDIILLHDDSFASVMEFSLRVVRLSGLCPDWCSLSISTAPGRRWNFWLFKWKLPPSGKMKCVDGISVRQYRRKVIRSGRAVYANIQKILLFQLPVNIAAITFNFVAVVHCDVPLIGFVAAVSSCSVPISAVQILWVNFFIITVGSLALAKEHPTTDLMLRPPIDQRKTLITNSMWTNILVQAVYQVTVLLILDYQGRNILNLKHDSNDHANKLKNTMMFNVFVLCQIFHIFNARNVEYNIFKGITSNFAFMVSVGVAVVTQVIIIEFLQIPFGTVKLNQKQWLISVGIGSMSWPLAVIGKMLPVPHFTELWIKFEDFLWKLICSSQVHNYLRGGITD